jgi:hypothetical protein
MEVLNENPILGGCFAATTVIIYRVPPAQEYPCVAATLWCTQARLRIRRMYIYVHTTRDLV